MIEYLRTKYEVIRQLGSGGMAKIYLARDKLTQKLVAIKLLHADKTFDTVAKERFKSEINLIQEVHSNAVVKLIDYEWNSNIQYLVMEYVEGVTLKEYLNSKTRLSVDEAVDMSKQIAAGFSEIHRAGIIHRDIKSQNIMVTDHGIVKIIDFGIALSQETKRVTRTGNIIASVQYLAPELLELSPPSKQSDIYALGIMMFEMLTGNVPYSEKEPETTAQMHRVKTVPDVNRIFDNIPQSVANVIIKATAKDTNKRYRDMYELYRDLDKSLSREMLYVERINLDGKKKFDFVNIVASKKFMMWMIIIISLIIVATIITIVLLKVV